MMLQDSMIRVVVKNALQVATAHSSVKKQLVKTTNVMQVSSVLEGQADLSQQMMSPVRFALLEVIVSKVYQPCRHVIQDTLESTKELLTLVSVLYVILVSTA